VKFWVVTYHLPHPDGTATGRHVFAVWDAIRGLGHEVEAWCWGEPPAGLEPPSWVTTAPFHDPGGWRTLPRTVRRPREGIAHAGWTPPADAVAWAEEPESYAAVAPAPRNGVTVHHSALLDALALRRPRPATIQSARAERRAVRRAGIAVTFSPRVARAVGARHLLPVTLPVPAAPVPPVTDPVAVMLADWAWPPNQVALDRLMPAWHTVRREVPGARLLLAGRGMTRRPSGAGVEILGEVTSARDVLERAAAFVFPCPATSGPKMKVLDALANGVPVVTTEAGIEGLAGVDKAVAISSDGQFPQVVTAVLKDQRRRALMAERGRRAVLEFHSPDVAAAARLRLVESRGWSE
jgi:Glycosyl transferases group 1